MSFVSTSHPSVRAGGDVLLLAQHFLGRAKNRRVVLSPEAAEKLAFHSWPGNVRELSNCMEHALTMAQQQEITLSDLPESVRSARAPSPHAEVSESAGSAQELVSLDEMERSYILKVLSAVGGNKTLAAKILGLDRKTLYRRLDRYQL